MVTHVVSQQPLSGKSLGTVGALEALLWGGAGRRKGGCGGCRRGTERTMSPEEGNHPGQKGTTQGDRGA